MLKNSRGLFAAPKKPIICFLSRQISCLFWAFWSLPAHSRSSFVPIFGCVERLGCFGPVLPFSVYRVQTQALEEKPLHCSDFDQDADSSFPSSSKSTRALSLGFINAIRFILLTFEGRLHTSYIPAARSWVPSVGEDGITLPNPPPLPLGSWQCSLLC